MAVTQVPTRPAATVLIPTHTHGETLRYSVPAALRQSVHDIEIFIVGDGVPDNTRRLAAELIAADPRLRFFDFPKGPSRGELHRHHVLAEARGEIVCYLFDDDLWLPSHVETMRALLRDADFAFSMPVVVRGDGSLATRDVNLDSPTHRFLFTHPKSVTPAVPTAAAHTMDLYRRLPVGWHTTPPGLAPDKYMWAQCLAVAGCRARSTTTPTSIIFPDPPRRHWSLDRRLAELAHWARRLDDADWLRQFQRRVAEAGSTSSVHVSVAYWLYAQSLRVPGAASLVISAYERLRAYRRGLQQRRGATSAPLAPENEEHQE